MTEHTQTAPPKPAQKSQQLEQLESALAAARNHMNLIPTHNELARGIQRRIIANYEAQIRGMTGGTEWLS